MKKLFSISLAIFWAGAVSLFAAGLVMYESEKNTEQAARGEERAPEEQNTNIAPTDSSNVVAGSVASDESGSYTTILETREEQQYLTPAIVAKHNTQDSCWLIIENGVYDVGEYVPFHPGGAEDILSSCGTDATAGFNNKRGSGDPHSASAWALLDNYFVANIGDPWGTVTVTEEVLVPAGEKQNKPTANTITKTTAGSANFSIGAPITTTSNISARQDPDTTGRLLAVEPKGSTGSIIGGPVEADGYWWYYVEYGDGVKGWSVQDYLSKDPNGSTGNNTSSAGDSTQATENTNTPTQNDPNPTNTNTNTPSGTTPADVATHNTANDCWFIISNKVYDVTQYIPFHPGGQNTIINQCGADATAAFNSAGHSNNAQNMLANYYVGDLAEAGTTPPSQPEPTPAPGTDTTPPSVAIVSHSDGGTVSGTITIEATALDSGGVASVEFKIGNQSIGTDTSAPYSATLDTTTYSDGNHTVSIVGTDTSGNTQSASITLIISNQPADTGGGNTGGLTPADVATHNTANDCWFIISNKVYDVTQYIPFHPGGQNTIINQCGADATAAFNNAGHSNNAQSMLANYYVGDVQTTPPPPPPPGTPECTSFTYGTWGICQANNTQTRPVLSSSPAGCAGGAPVTTQSCVYTPPASPDQPYRDTIEAEYPGANIIKLTVEDNGQAEFKFTHNGQTYEGKMNAQYEIIQIE